MKFGAYNLLFPVYLDLTVIGFYLTICCKKMKFHTSGSAFKGSGVQCLRVTLVPKLYLGTQLFKKFQFVFLIRDTADLRSDHFVGYRKRVQR